MSEPRTNTDSICRKLCPTTEEGQLQHSEECAFVCGLIARCDQLKVEVERYYGDLCHIVEIIGKVSPEAAPYAVGHVQAYVNKANDELEQARTGIESQRARAEKAEVEVERLRLIAEPTETEVDAQLRDAGIEPEIGRAHV